MLQLARCKGIDTSPAVTWTQSGPWDPAPRVPEQIEVSTMSRQQGGSVSRHSWSMDQVWTCGLLQIMVLHQLLHYVRLHCLQSQ